MSDVTREQVLEDLHRVMRDAEALLRATSGEAGEKIGAARAAAEASLHVARERLAELGGQAAEQVSQTARRYAREHPWALVGAGVAAGLLIALLLTRRGERGP